MVPLAGVLLKKDSGKIQWSIDSIEGGTMGVETCDKTRALVKVEG